jgi:hypothetical protein
MEADMPIVVRFTRHDGRTGRVTVNWPYVGSVPRLAEAALATYGIDYWTEIHSLFWNGE